MVEVALLGWIPICVVLFACLSPAKALTLSYLGGWLFLPMLRIPIQRFWDIDKILTTNVGAILGTLLFASHTLRGYRVTFADVALFLFAGSAFASSVAAGWGAYDGVSSFTHELFYYAVPFGLGRAILRDRPRLLEASRMIVFGAAVYALLALWEWRMSPQIHSTLYGMFQHRFLQTHRWGFFRPIVCFPHALSLGMFMCWASMLAIWLHRSGRLGSVMSVPPVILIGLPLFALVASMSMSPWGLFLVGVGLLFLWQRTRQRMWLWCPIVFAMIWMAGRYTGNSDGQWLTSLASQISNDRAESLRYRIDAESVVLENAKKNPMFGFGRGKHQTGQEESARRLASDGLWVIVLGRYGLVGVVLFYLWWCWPMVLARSASQELERDPALMVQLVAIAMESVNFLFNGVTNPLVVLMIGGAVSGLQGLQRRGTAVTRRVTRAPRTRTMAISTGSDS
ncbi:MAG: O-antigen ligase family protein [Planctomycetota bacterium]